MMLARWSAARRGTILTAGLVWLLLMAPPALAQRCQAPPGTAAIEQYCETVPSGTGERPAVAGVQATLPPSTERALRASGGDGEALADLLTADRPRRARGGEGAPMRRRWRAVAPPVGSNPLNAVRASVESGATLGGGFVWLMTALTVLASGAAWWRHRRRSES
jgi:hypothetical protein